MQIFEVSQTMPGVLRIYRNRNFLLHIFNPEKFALIALLIWRMNRLLRIDLVEK